MEEFFVDCRVLCSCEDHEIGLSNRKNLNLNPRWSKPPSQGGPGLRKGKTQKPSGELHPQSHGLRSQTAWVQGLPLSLSAVCGPGQRLNLTRPQCPCWRHGVTRGVGGGGWDEPLRSSVWLLGHSSIQEIWPHFSTSSWGSWARFGSAQFEEKINQEDSKGRGSREPHLTGEAVRKGARTIVTPISQVGSLRPCWHRVSYPGLFMLKAGARSAQPAPLFDSESKCCVGPQG